MGFFDTLNAVKADLAFQKQDFETADKLYKKITSKKHASNGNIIKYAYFLIYLGRLEECKKELDRVDYDSLTEDILKITYKTSEALYTWKSGDIDKAIEIYESLHKNYKNTSIYETLGYLYIVKKDFNTALKYNLEAYDYAKDNNVIIDNLAETYYYLGEKDKAKKLYENMFNVEDSKKPKFSECYYYYGLILKEENNIEKANEMFNTALEMRESFLSGLTHEDIKKEIQ